MRIVDNIASIHRADSLNLLKFVQVVHEIDKAFLHFHLHVSIISISLALHNWSCV